MVAEDGVRVGGTVIQEVRDGIKSGMGSFRLSGRKAAKGNQKSAVNGARIIQQGADHLLEEQYTRGGERG